LLLLLIPLKTLAINKINKNTLGYEHFSSRKAWMNTPIMCGYLAVVDKHCVGRKCMLLLDNFSAHNASEDWMNDEGGLNNLKIIFFPLIGITAYQTLDQGIIPGFRA
jgi:hypothetical protein